MQIFILSVNRKCFDNFYRKILAIDFYPSNVSLEYFISFAVEQVDTFKRVELVAAASCAGNALVI